MLTRFTAVYDNVGIRGIYFIDHPSKETVAVYQCTYMVIGELNNTHTVETIRKIIRRTRFLLVTLIELAPNLTPKASRQKRVPTAAAHVGDNGTRLRIKNLPVVRQGYTRENKFGYKMVKKMSNIHITSFIIVCDSAMSASRYAKRAAT